MPDWIADYRLLRPLADPVNPGRYLAEPPARLGVGTRPVVVEVGSGDAIEVVEYLNGWAQAASSGHPGTGTDNGDGTGHGLVTPLEVDTLEPTGPGASPTLWVSRAVAVDEHTPADPVRVIAGAAAGLAALHRAGRIHGAVAAGRILTTPSGGVLDIPPLRGPAVPGLLMRIGAVSQLDGLAPEVARGAPLSSASDVWALGACLHRAVTGSCIHPGIEDDLLLTAVTRVVREAIVIAADELSEVVAACCSGNPDNRPTASEVASWLKSEVSRS